MGSDDKDENEGKGGKEKGKKGGKGQWGKGRCRRGGQVGGKPGGGGGGGGGGGKKKEGGGGGGGGGARKGGKDGKQQGKQQGKDNGKDKGKRDGSKGKGDGSKSPPGEGGGGGPGGVNGPGAREHRHRHRRTMTPYGFPRFFYPPSPHVPTTPSPHGDDDDPMPVASPPSEGDGARPKTPRRPLRFALGDSATLAVQFPPPPLPLHMPAAHWALGGKPAPEPCAPLGMPLKLFYSLGPLAATAQAHPRHDTYAPQCHTLRHGHKRRHPQPNGYDTRRRAGLVTVTRVRYFEDPLRLHQRQQQQQRLLGMQRNPFAGIAWTPAPASISGSSGQPEAAWAKQQPQQPPQQQSLSRFKKKRFMRRRRDEEEDEEADGAVAMEISPREAPCVAQPLLLPSAPILLPRLPLAPSPPPPPPPPAAAVPALRGEDIRTVDPHAAGDHPAAQVLAGGHDDDGGRRSPDPAHHRIRSAAVGLVPAALRLALGRLLPSSPPGAAVAAGEQEGDEDGEHGQQQLLLLGAEQQPPPPPPLPTASSPVLQPQPQPQPHEFAEAGQQTTPRPQPQQQPQQQQQQLLPPRAPPRAEAGVQTLPVPQLAVELVHPLLLTPGHSLDSSSSDNRASAWSSSPSASTCLMDISIELPPEEEPGQQPQPEQQQQEQGDEEAAPQPVLAGAGLVNAYKIDGEEEEDVIEIVPPLAMTGGSSLSDCGSGSGSGGGSDEQEQGQAAQTADDGRPVLDIVSVLPTHGSSLDGPGEQAQEQPVQPRQPLQQQQWSDPRLVLPPRRWVLSTRSSSSSSSSSSASAASPFTTHFFHQPFNESDDGGGSFLATPRRDEEEKRGHDEEAKELYEEGDMTLVLRRLSSLQMVSPQVRPSPEEEDEEQGEQAGDGVEESKGRELSQP